MKMPRNDLLSVGNFAKITRTTLHTLRYYDEIQLLSPVQRGTNNYRYYSIKQLAFANAVCVLQKLGLPLAAIKKLSKQRTPELAQEILSRQVEEIDAKRAYLEKTHKLLHTMLKSIQSGLDADHDAISIEFLPSANIVLGELNDYSNGRNDDDTLISFYQNMYRRYPVSDHSLHYPVWRLFSAEHVKSRNWLYPDRYYYYNPDGEDQRPAAMYAIGYSRAGYGHNEDLFRRIIEYIEQSNFEICGDAYEEYPQNELCIIEEDNYLQRIMITVQMKNNLTQSSG
jgi:DNA-binding transcriptional MerR regulator